MCYTTLKKKELGGNMYTIENERFRAILSPNGAEVQSFIDKKYEKEWIWHGDPKFWKRRAPVLFPFVGKLKDNQYTVAGTSYHLPQHGFARDQVFQVTQHGNTSISFRLTSKEETLQVYPFVFSLEITYLLTDQGLHTSYHVHNPGDQTLYFSIGGHPALMVDIDQEGWVLEFEKDEHADLHLLDLSLGLYSGQTRPILSGDHLIPLSHDLFDIDTLVFDGLKSDYVQARNRLTGEGIRLHCKGFPQLGVWTPGAPFLCLVPWYGLADQVTSSGRIEDKRGIQTLEAGGNFRCTYVLEPITTQDQ